MCWTIPERPRSPISTGSAPWPSRYGDAFLTIVRERQGPVGRDEGAAATRVSRSLAAYHLDKLARLGLLEVEYGRPPDAAAQAPAGPRSSTGRQRASSRSAFRRAITDFSPSCLCEPRRAPRGRLCARRSSGRLPNSARSSAPGQEAWSRCCASTATSPSKPTGELLRLRNCPFAAVAARCPKVVCSLNLALIRGVLAGLGADPSAALLEPRAGECCVAIQTTRSAQRQALDVCDDALPSNA